MLAKNKQNSEEEEEEEIIVPDSEVPEEAVVDMDAEDETSSKNGEENSEENFDQTGIQSMWISATGTPMSNFLDFNIFRWTFND